MMGSRKKTKMATALKEEPLDMLPSEKYEKVKVICKNLALMLAQAPMTQFICGYAALEKLQDAWVAGRNIQLTLTEYESEEQLLTEHSDMLQALIDGNPDTKTVEMDLPDDDEEEKDSKQFCCDQCGKTFRRAGELNKHLSKHRTYECGVCSRQFDTDVRLALHENTHTKEEIELASVNGPIMKSGLKLFECALCHKILYDKRSYTTHMNSHTDARPFVCAVCEKGFKSPQALRVHMRLHTGERPYACSLCDKKFVQSSNLMEHMKRHNGTAKKHICKVCEEQFTERSDLIRHNNAAHPEMTGRKGNALKNMINYQCPHCSKILKYRTSIKGHMMIHSGERPFLCQQCPMSFRDRSCLRKHRILRHGNSKREFMCQTCGASFMLAASLKRHMMTHSDYKAFSCRYCERRFKAHSALRSHERMHTGEKPHTCSVCGRSFIDRTGLLRHQKTHLNTTM